MGLGTVAKVGGERRFLPLENKIHVSRFISLSREWNSSSSKFPSQSHPSQALQGCTCSYLQSGLFKFLIVLAESSLWRQTSNHQTIRQRSCPAQSEDGVPCRCISEGAGVSIAGRVGRYFPTWNLSSHMCVPLPLLQTEQWEIRFTGCVEK